MKKIFILILIAFGFGATAQDSLNQYKKPRGSWYSFDKFIAERGLLAPRLSTTPTGDTLGGFLWYDVPQQKLKARINGAWVELGAGGGGGGTVTGSGTANRLAYWNGASSITSSAAFTVDATSGASYVNLQGALTFTDNTHSFSTFTAPAIFRVGNQIYWKMPTGGLFWWDGSGNGALSLDGGGSTFYQHINFSAVNKEFRFDGSNDYMKAPVNDSIEIGTGGVARILAGANGIRMPDLGDGTNQRPLVANSDGRLRAIPLGTAGQVFRVNAAGTGMEFATVSGGGGSPGGLTTQVQFNDAGAFGGDADFVWDKTDNILSVGGRLRFPTAVAFTGSSAGDIYKGTVDGLTFRGYAGSSNHITFFDGLANTILAGNSADIGTGSAIDFYIAPTKRLYLDGKSDTYISEVSANIVNFVLGSTEGLRVASTGIRMPASAYSNWGATSGSTGYGIRDNAGTMETKNSGGSWQPMAPCYNCMTRSTVEDANHTALSTEHLIEYTALSATRTVTLPTAASMNSGGGVTAKYLIIKDGVGNAGTNNIIIDGNGTETIDGATTKTINANYGSIRIYSTGTAWFTF